MKKLALSLIIASLAGYGPSQWFAGYLGQAVGAATATLTLFILLVWNGTLRDWELWLDLRKEKRERKK